MPWVTTACMRESSSALGARSSSPSTAIRTVPWGISMATFGATRRSKRARYSPTVDQSRATLGPGPFQPMSCWWSTSRVASVTGASPSPSWPSTSSVTPCMILHSHVGSARSARSEWVCMSTKPGQTARPSASIVRVRRLAVEPADRRDAVAADAHVGAVPGVAGSVDHPAVPDQQVEHDGLLSRNVGVRPSGSPLPPVGGGGGPGGGREVRKSQSTRRPMYSAAAFTVKAAAVATR